ncbi:hypothetical protein Tco_0512202, partial [Tanacetum coccineum]
EDLAAGTPSSKILAKAEASQKRKASTFGTASSHVAKRTRFVLAQSSGSTTRPSLFAGDDDYACVKILLVTPLRSTAVIPLSGNQDSRGNKIMVDDAVAPSGGVSRQRPSSGPAPSFRDVFGDAIHTDFFPFFAGPYYATYHVDGVVGNFDYKDECAALYDDVAWWLKGYGEKVGSLTGLELQVSALKRQVSNINDKHSSSDASIMKSKAKGEERKKNIKSLTKSVDNFHSEVARLSTALNQATVLEAEKDEEILRLKTTPPEVQGELLSLASSDGFERGLSMHQTKDKFAVLEPEKLVRPANVPALREVRVSPPTKDSTVTPASKSLELSNNVNFTASDVASEHNEEMVNAEVDGSDPKMTNDTATVKSGHAFVQGISVSLDDVVELVEVGSRRVSFGPNDVVVAFSAHEKGDGLDPSSAAGEEVAANPSRV